MCQEVIQLKEQDPAHPQVVKAKERLLDIYSDQSWRAATSADLAERDATTALQAAEKAIELASDKSNAWANFGVALHRNRRHEEAIEALEKARDMRGGEDPHHRFFLAMAYWKLGREEAALSEYVHAARWLDAKKRTEEQYRYRQEVEALIGTERIKSYTSTEAEEVTR